MNPLQYLNVGSTSSNTSGQNGALPVQPGLLENMFEVDDMEVWNTTPFGIE